MQHNLVNGVALIGVAVLSVVAHALIVQFVRRALPSMGGGVTRSFLQRTKAPTRVILPLIGMAIVVGVVRLPSNTAAVLVHALEIGLIISISWFIVRLTYVLEDVALQRFADVDADNLRSRQIRTQIQVFRRVIVALVIMLAIALALLTFKQVRVAGAGLLASAGLIGIVVGVAAKPVVTNILAGIQIAISQPIRVDDVVVVQGEWGRIEEINLTYVVVRIWDLRRLVLPISWFIENTFQNWTRTSSAILGYVYFEVDYSAPVQDIRDHLHELLVANPLWDKETWNLQVTNSTASSLQLRALMGAADSSSRWNLECEIREEIVNWLHKNYPSTLPKVRGMLEQPLWEQPGLDRPQ